eukprot:5662567-Prymnesium_polylepis.1
MLGGSSRDVPVSRWGNVVSIRSSRVDFWASQDVGTCISSPFSGGVSRWWRLEMDERHDERVLS